MEGLPNKRTLFVDLDGVLADFDGGFPAKFGVDHRSMLDADMWAKIHADDFFFRDLPPCPGALAFFSKIRQYKPVILTACPTEHYIKVATQKREWVRGHLGDAIFVLPCQGGKHKQLFMHRHGDILIDDFVRNVQRWHGAGGSGILHTNFKDTWEQLEEYL